MKSQCGSRAKKQLHSWSLLPIDGTKLREKARREYEKALRGYEKARAESERFHNEDKPQFEKWLHKHFGRTLTEIREVRAQVESIQTLILEVKEEFCFGRHRTEAAAYRAVKRRREAPPPEPPRETARGGETDDPFENAEFRARFEEAFNAEKEFWERMFQPRAENNGNGTGRTNGRLKELYRALARRLHPDAAESAAKTRSARELELWHETQAAYEAGDVEQLEMILTLVEVRDEGDKNASVSVLSRLTRGFKSKLAALRRQLTKLRRDPAWNFSRLSDSSELFQRIHWKLQRDLQEARMYFQQFQEIIQHWESAPAGRRTRPSPRSAGYVDEEWF